MFQIPLIASLKVRKQHSITEADVYIKKMSGQDLNPQTPGLVQWTLQTEHVYEPASIEIRTQCSAPWACDITFPCTQN